jgi:uncharacterized membrane-anchored protein YhcB (DUF1043 family)
MESMYIYAFGRQLNKLKEQLDKQNNKLNSHPNTTYLEAPIRRNTKKDPDKL